MNPAQGRPTVSDLGALARAEGHQIGHRVCSTVWVSAFLMPKTGTVHVTEAEDTKGRLGLLEVAERNL